MENRRKLDRTDKVIKCEVHSENMTFSSTLDMSEGGLFISTPEPLLEGSEVTLVMRLEDDRVLKAQGIVKWTRDDETDNIRAGMGVEFKNLDDTEVTEIRTFLEG